MFLREDTATTKILTGEYSVCGSLGEQKESTRTSHKGFGFGGSGIARDMALPSRYMPRRRELGILIGSVGMWLGQGKGYR